MSEQTFDTTARRLARSLDRRGSLGVLGATALALAARPATVRAVDAAKKAKKKCKRQRGPCQNFVRESCNDRQECIEARGRCCGLLAKCKFAAFVDCFDSADQTMESARGSLLR